jgi:zinc transport system substrate-binding protein
MIFMKRRISALGLAGVLPVLTMLPILSGCSALTADDDGKPQVVAAFYPFAYVAQRVVGNHATVTNLTSPGLEPHDLELTPQQVADLSVADLVVYEKGFQPSVDQAVDQNAEGETLDVTDVVPLEDTGAPNEDGADLAGDPHVWQDPVLLESVAGKVADDMADADPAHAKQYRANADALKADLDRLDHDFTQGLSECRRREFVTSHAAFGYLAKRYDLTMIPIAGLSPDVEPSPQHIAQIQDLIRSDGITTVFSETLGSKQYADTLSHDLGVKSAVLDPIEGLTRTDSRDDYLSLMRKNLAALEEANDCS